MLLVLLTLCLAMAVPSTEALSDAWSSQFKTLSEHTHQPVLLGDADFQRVSEGKIAKRRLNQEGPDRAIGVGWTPHSREAIWSDGSGLGHDTTRASSVGVHCLFNFTNCFRSGLRL